MNYYQHHIGDFIRDTARLTDSQCMAYLRLLWLYYETEEPLSGDVDAIAFRIGANACDVQQILKHYFFEHEGMWHQARCDKEILAFRNKSDKAKKSAEARWNNAKAIRTHTERNANEPVFDANQEPVTINHKPVSKEKPLMSGKPDAITLISFLNDKAGKNYRAVDSNLNPLMARMKEGATVQEIKSVIAMKVRQWGADEKMSEYLRPDTLFNKTKFWQYHGQLHQEPVNVD